MIPSQVRGGAAALLFAVGITACGGSGTSTSQNLAADRVAARAAALKLSDLGSGWTSAPNTPNAPGVDAQLATCLGLGPTEITGDGPADATSPTFADSDNETVSNAVAYTASVAEAQHQLAAYEASKAPGCLAASLSAEQRDEVAHPDPANPLPAGLTFGTPSVVAVAPVNNRYPEFDFDVLVPYSVSGDASETQMVIQMATRGRAVVEIDFESGPPPTPQTGITTFLSIILGRLAKT